MTRSTVDIGRNLRWPILGTLLAISATTILDAVGLSNFNALPLIPLFLLFWYLQRLSRVEVGLTWGRWQDYALAVVYPLLVLGLIGLLAALSGAVTRAAIDWAKVVPMLVGLMLA